MEFANAVRAELARVLPRRRCCRQAELAAFIRFLGVKAEDGVNVTTGHAAVARKVFLLGKHVPQTTVETAEPGPSRGRYHVRLTLDEAVPDAMPRRQCCARAYVRGAWLSRGSVTEPEAGYHLEFALGSGEQARDIQGLLQRDGVSGGIIHRKNDHVVYVKDADGIAEVLRLTGAHGALLTWEDFRVLKHMRNRVNRLVNAETANMEKAVGAALRQLEDIRLIEERQGLTDLPPSLKEVARLRIVHPDLSLADLGKQLSPPLSKSAVNHRMRRLAQRADDLRRSSIVRD